MVAATDEIIQHAISLPLDQRAAIVAALQKSMHNDLSGQDFFGDEDVEKAWSREILHRIEELKSGAVKAIPSTEAWKQIDETSSSDL